MKIPCNICLGPFLIWKMLLLQYIYTYTNIYIYIHKKNIYIYIFATIRRPLGVIWGIWGTPLIPSVHSSNNMAYRQGALSGNPSPSWHTMENVAVVSIYPLIRFWLSGRGYIDPRLSTIRTLSIDTDKYFPKLIKSNRNQIVFIIFRLIWKSKRTASVCCSKSK